jgi:regulator of sigma E protease
VSLFVAILGIVLLVILHEFGHFLAARAAGMRVERFSVFFPPTLVSVRRGETEYGIGAIPAGGYVKITGMTTDELKDVDLRIAARSYALQPPWRRIVVILAGPGVNLLIAWAVFWAILASGSVNGDVTLSDLNPSIPTVVPSTSVQAVTAGSPAAAALRPGDRILSVDGRRATVTSTMLTINSHRCAGEVRDGCQASTPVVLRIERGGRALSVVVKPRYSAKYKRMLIGFGFGTAAKHFGVLAAAGVAVHEMWSTTTHLISSVGHAFTSEKVRHEFHSIVGITQIAQESVSAGPGFALVVLAFISLVLAVINLFPFLPLDGGHVLWAAAEKVRKRRISVAAMYRFSTPGIVLLLFLVLNGVSNDISRLGG